LRTRKVRKTAFNLPRSLVPSEEEQNLLSNLNLTIKQYIAISLKTPYLTPEEKD